jgi:asparagine synthase (glutamine-hydrolysing)
MCGITGIISRKPISASVIKKMNDKIIHRGPDSEGYLIGGDFQSDIELEKKCFCDSSISFALGHRRLSIVDLSDLGHQPMNYIDRYWITYNGEIYNHIELRKELEMKGYIFKSHTDTEVIMAAYDCWGIDSLNKFNGMWTFVLFDQLKEEFFISRDRFGIKPLYYYQDKDIFVFSSEIKSILENPNVVTKFDQKFCEIFIEEGSKEYLKNTAFENIYRFDFNSFLICKGHDLFLPFKEQKFWFFKPNLSNELYNHDQAIVYAKKYFELLDDAVRVRLRADVKVGSASSGGLDSSSIVYLINQQLKEAGKSEKQETFSTVYNSPGTENCDESKFIDHLTSTLNVNSNKIEPLEKQIPTEHQKLVYALENPPENTLISSWFTFKLVKSADVVVTLDGQGADEQLAGYLPYITIYWANKGLKSFLSELIKFKETNTFKYALVGLIANLMKRFLGKKLVLWFFSKVLKKKINLFQNLNERLHYDSLTHLVTLIHFADHTSMAHSIESRMPFMDYRLFEFLSSVPACYKIHNGWTKYIARLAFDKKLPDSITWRKDKMGWPIPEEKWFKGNLYEWFSEEVRNGFRFVSRTPPQDVFSIGKVKAVRYLNLSVFQKTFFPNN